LVIREYLMPLGMNNGRNNSNNNESNSNKNNNRRIFGQNVDNNHSNNNSKYVKLIKRLDDNWNTGMHKYWDDLINFGSSML
jgi:hypothetical protein